jgi:hypothetical protein
MLSYESRQRYLQGQKNGIEWPPLLDEDLNRIAEAVFTIWANEA